ncbi:hypothetical protein LK536_27260 [Lachnoclostridium pacaense]|uniref:hypothetical protein n=1 Tax=Enterocloster TaxID=2719313 RepID=UPI001D082653|nr:hypothetical protein [Lachnoclostridium pacaense]MCB7335966.1 hypothetical protein [Enterocloster aldenensis]MCC2879957.1 hypothetical protein [Lachnoclostridium pacaense]DAQ87575.1 MAG TPA: hypothetical protein [Caudoviricetes sp.]
MGLFGKKEKIPDGIRVMYYEGELNEFPVNQPCQILLMEDCLRITKNNPYTEVRLDRNRILSVEVLGKNDYMQRYKGNAESGFRKGDIPTSYYVINYLDKNGDKKQIVFWSASSSALKVMRLRDELTNKQKSKSYEI